MTLEHYTGPIHVCYLRITRLRHWRKATPRRRRRALLLKYRGGHR